MHQLAQLARRSLVVFIALVLGVDSVVAQCLPVPLGPVVSSDPDASDWFGYSVDMDGDRFVAGAPRDDEKNSRAGAAYVFEWDGSAWVETAKLMAADGAADDEFGSAVAVDGDRIVVGAPLHDVGGSNGGAVYIFEYFPSQGWLQAMKLWKPGAGIQLGSSVAVHGNRLAAGCGSGSSYAYLYKNVGGIWNVEKSFSITGSHRKAVALHDDVFAVGNAWYDAGSGSDHGLVRLYEYSGNSWTLAQTYQGSSNYYTGYSLALEPDRMVVGRRGKSAMVYVKDGSGWPSTGAGLGGPSYSVSVSSDRVVVGTKSNQLLLYQEGVSGWQLVSTNPNSGAQSGDNLGASVASSGDKFIAGAFTSDIAATDAGAVFTFGFKNAETYCTSKVTTIPNCFARMNGTGTPSYSNPDGFEIKAGPSPGGQVGIFFWSKTGPAAIPFQLGYLCVQSPVLRSKGILSGGTKGNCDGRYRMLLSDLAARDPQFGAGLNYYVQAWFRDPGNAFSSSLSNALWFVVCN